MKRNRTILNCGTCSKEISLPPSMIKNGKGKFCSRKCMAMAYSKRQKGAGSHFWKGGEATRQCRHCGKGFAADQYRVSIGQGNFCSIVCNLKYQSKQMTGAKHPGWKGGITPILVSIRNSIKGSEWRKQVFIRDRFTCKRCGQIGGRLCAHHIKRFSEIIEDTEYNLPLINIYDAAMLYDPLWDINNGITLCESCHKEEHKKAVV